MLGALVLSLCIAEPDFRALERQAMRERVQRDRQRSSFLRREEGELFRSIRDVERSLLEHGQRLSAVDRRNRALEQEIAASGRALEAVDMKLVALRQSVGRRLAAMSRLRKTPMADLLAQTDRTKQQGKIRRMLHRVLEYDAELVGKVRAAEADARSLRDNLVSTKEGLVEVRADLERGAETGRTLRRERRGLLRMLRKERGLVDKLRREMSRAEATLGREAPLRGVLPAPPMRSGGFARQKGRLPWPVVGRVEASFGKRVDIPSGMVLLHHGIDIRAPWGEPIQTPFGGRVVHAAPISGFGQVLILDHGEQWFTVYAHLERFTVAPGDRVRAHQTVAHVGDTDSEKDAYLYFEIRRGAEALNPLDWFCP